MKKFLVILMVVAMASFLFVGCLPTTPEVVEEEEVVVEEVVEEEEVVVEVVQTDTPYITAVAPISILATTTQYALTQASVLVDGVGVAGAIIKLYIDDVYAGVGTTGSNGAFANVGITGITLTEGVKVLHVTATIPGLAESDASTAYTFTYDKTKPTIASVVGDSSSSYITVTFSEAVKASTVVAATWLYGSGTNIAYVAASQTPSAIAASSSTTAVLYEVTSPTGTAVLETDDFLTVKCTGTIKDLAGNVMVSPVTVLGTVVP